MDFSEISLEPSTKTAKTLNLQQNRWKVGNFADSKD